MDASHFRQRAAIARELAQAGEDRRLAHMLLELAIDLDAEAEAIEAEQARTADRHPASATAQASATAPDGNRAAAPIIDLTTPGVKSPVDTRPSRFSAVVLPFPARGLPQETTLPPAARHPAARATPPLAVPAPPQPSPADTQADICTLLTIG